jgi:putative endonuclease
VSAAWHIYLLRCRDGSFYTGIARDVGARFAQHAAGRGARYTRGRGPLALVYVEPAADRGEALRREAAIRRLDRAKKEALASMSAEDASTWLDNPHARSPSSSPTAGETP